MDVLADPSIVVNDAPIDIVPNSVSYKEGAGEQSVRASSTGGGNTTQVYANNVETNFGMVKFEFFPAPRQIDFFRGIKKNLNNNVVVLTGTTTDGQRLRRTFNRAALLTDYEVPLGTDTTIELEFNSDPAV